MKCNAERVKRYDGALKSQSDLEPQVDGHSQLARRILIMGAVERVGSEDVDRPSEHD